MFIALEGIDGSGKSSVSKHLSGMLEKSGYSVWNTMEPTSSLKIPESLSLDHSFTGAVEQFLLFTADRMKHVREISSKLESHDFVISDRFIMSSFAYQGVIIAEKTGSLDSAIDWMKSVSSFIDLSPDLTILLDIDPELAMKRVTSRGRRTGFEDPEYLSMVRRAYLSIPINGLQIVDGSGSIEAVSEECLKIIRGRIRK